MTPEQYTSIKKVELEELHQENARLEAELAARTQDRDDRLKNNLQLRDEIKRLKAELAATSSLYNSTLTAQLVSDNSNKNLRQQLESARLHLQNILDVWTGKGAAGRVITEKLAERLEEAWDWLHPEDTLEP